MRKSLSLHKPSLCLESMPECRTLTRQTQPFSFPHSWTAMTENLLKTFWESQVTNWYLLWEPFSFSSPSPGCKTMAWGFPLRADVGLAGGGTVVSIALPWQRRFLMKWLRSIRAAVEKQLLRGFALFQFCFQKRLLLLLRFTRDQAVLRPGQTETCTWQHPLYVFCPASDLFGRLPLQQVLS